MEKEMKAMLGIKEASQKLGISTSYLKKGIKENTIPYIKSGKKYYILCDSLMKQLEEEAQNRMKTN